MSSTRELHRTAFVRWASLADADMRDAVLSASERICAKLIESGFSPNSVPFDGSGLPAHAINLNRAHDAEHFEYVVVSFEKRHSAQVQLFFGVKGMTPPHSWVRAGSLVWKPGSELQKHKWWGAKWWTIGKVAALNSAAIRVESLVPQVVEFLSSGHVGTNIHNELGG